MSRLLLSKEHGLSPSLLCCPLCGADTGVALCGRLPGDAEAPRRTRDVGPCAKCEEYMELGVLLIEVEDHGPDRRTTGRLSVVRPEYLRRVLDAGSAEEAVRMRAAHVDVAVYEALGLGAQPHDEVKP